MALTFGFTTGRLTTLRDMVRSLTIGFGEVVEPVPALHFGNGILLVVLLFLGDLNSIRKFSALFLSVLRKKYYLCSRNKKREEFMMETTNIPRQLLVTVDGSTNIANVTRAIKMLRGVTTIKLAKTATRKPRLYDPETGEYLNDKTMKAIEDVRSGKEPTYEMNSMEEFKAWCEAL